MGAETFVVSDGGRGGGGKLLLEGGGGKFKNSVPELQSRKNLIGKCLKRGSEEFLQGKKPPYIRPGGARVDRLDQTKEHL